MKIQGGSTTRLAIVLFAIAIVNLVGCSSNSTPAFNNSGINQALWVANGTNVVEFLPSQFSSATTAVAPHLTNNSGSFGAPQGVVFDSSGNLWVVDGGTVAAGGTTPALYQFTAAQLAALGSNNNPTPNITINSTCFMFPQQAVFDSSGNLWVTDSMANAVYEFTPAQLLASNTAATPNATLTAAPPSPNPNNIAPFTGPLGIAFDSAGDLWVANNGGTCIFAFSAAGLSGISGVVALTPSVVLGDDGADSVQAPWALVFDASGNLWSSNANTNSTNVNAVVEFPASQLGGIGSSSANVITPTPVVTLVPTTDNGNNTLSSPNGIAFDSEGDLAVVSSLTPFGLALFGQSQVFAGGAPKPDVLLVGETTTLDAPAGAVFGPVVN
jgi:sugar lactone lactonase YvrE